MNKNATIHIVGSGLIGPLAALILAQKGFKVELHERRSDMRKNKISAGRSINLVITDRGLRALEPVGLRDKVMDITIPMKGRMLHDLESNQTFVPYGQKENEVINAVSRGLLNCFLMDAAEENGNVNINFNRHCTHYDIQSKTLTFENDETSKEEKIQADIVIGADGAFSAIRRAMMDHVHNFNYAQDFLEHGYKELVIPPASDDGGFLIEKRALHIWPRKNYMLIALPNVDGSFTCTLFYPFEGIESFANLQTEKEVIAFFERMFPDALKIMPTLAEDFFANPIGSLATIRCNPWHVGGQALLLGDAAHAIVPFYGQGMNCGFEDCTALGELLDEGYDDWEPLFKKLNERRKPNTDAIADMALENFIEMRATTADPKFQLKKKVGFELEKRHPNRFIPRYSMVMFHPEIPYAEAQRRSIIQDKILNTLCANIAEPEQTDWEEAERLIGQMGH